MKKLVIILLTIVTVTSLVASCNSSTTTRPKSASITGVSSKYVPERGFEISGNFEITESAETKTEGNKTSTNGTARHEYHGDIEGIFTTTFRREIDNNSKSTSAEEEGSFTGTIKGKAGSFTVRTKGMCKWSPNPGEMMSWVYRYENFLGTGGFSSLSGYISSFQCLDLGTGYYHGELLFGE